MGSPAGMTNAQHGVGQRAGLNLSIQRSDLTGLLAPADVPVGVHCYASGVIAAVFQTAQPFQNYVEGEVITVTTSVTNISNNSTHGC